MVSPWGWSSFTLPRKKSYVGEALTGLVFGTICMFQYLISVRPDQTGGIGPRQVGAVACVHMVFCRLQVLGPLVL